jgi:hypothetical protein
MIKRLGQYAATTLTLNGATPENAHIAEMSRIRVD